MPINQIEDEPVSLTNTPRVLTRATIPALTQDLDASDVLEIYSLVRSAPLHGIANSTITIQKMALGIRYRPKAGALASPLHVTKEPVEMALEYGPQRVGPQLTHEAVPFIQVEASSSFIAWDNVGKVYYTTKIVAADYLSSYYMGSMTGAVLSKILVEAVEYAEKRRRYQPFSVYSEEHGKEVRSSSSTDFVEYMWFHLANLGVEIEPILPPPIYEARLWVSSVKKAIPEASVAHAAATFYQKLFQCLESIATNDYTPYIPTASPTKSPAPTETHTISTIPSSSPTVPSTNIPTSYTSQGPTTHPSTLSSALPSAHPSSLSSTPPSAQPSSNDDEIENNTNHSGEQEASQGNQTSNEPIDDSTNATGTGGRDNSTKKNNTDVNLDENQDDNTDSIGEDHVNDEAHDDESNTTNSTNTTDIEGGRIRGRNLRTEKMQSSSYDMRQLDEQGDDFAASTSNEKFDVASTTPTTTFPTESPTTFDTLAKVDSPSGSSSSSNTERAKQAAQVAHDAADEAMSVAVTEGDNKVVDLAQVAASAAQAAADATSSAAAEAAMDGLLSGDGAMMTSVITTCLSDPMYDIATVDENGTVTTEAYVYRDGSLYYKLVLSDPYFEVARINRPLPRVKLPSAFGTGGDFIDWMLALSVIGLLFLAVVLILQQMGHRYVNWLFKCQRWYFNPRKYDYEGQAILGEGMSTFGEDGIPLSMGGRRTSVSPLQNRIIKTYNTSSRFDGALSMPTLSHDSGISGGGGNGGGGTPTTIGSGKDNGSRRHRVPSGGDLQLNDGYRDDIGDVELSTLSKQMNHIISRSGSGGALGVGGNGNGDTSSIGSCLSDDEMSVDIVPERLTRDPELVDLPHLKSKTKVAVPVGSKNNGSKATKKKKQQGKSMGVNSPSSCSTTSSSSPNKFTQQTTTETELI